MPMTDPATPEPGSADGFALSALTQAELAAWLRLDLTPGIGRATARRLLAAFGSAEAIWQQPPPRWREVVVPGVGHQQGGMAKAAEAELFGAR